MRRFTTFILLSISVLCCCPCENGKDGVDGQNGEDGANGQNGEDGENGANGQNGEDGEDGTNGQNGEDGEDGTNGQNGENGANGQNGEDGTDGVDGDKGDDACSVVVTESTPGGIQAGVDLLSATGGTVCVLQGVYTLTEHIHIVNDNTRILGVGPATHLFVANEANVAAIVVGSLDADPTGDKTIGVSIEQLSIDGNKDNQTTETYTVGPSATLYVNGISTFYSQDVKIRDVSIENVRSGAIVTDRGVENLVIDHVTARNSYWDGLAFYDTHHVVVTNSILENNGAAGVTADKPSDEHEGFFSSTLNGNVIAGNGAGNPEMSDPSPGLFLRYTDDVIISDNVIEDNAGNGLWLENSSSNRIADNQLLENGNNGIVFNTGSDSNTLDGNTFANNGEYGVWSIVGTTSFAWDSFYCENVVGNLLAQGTYYENSACDCETGC